MPIPPEISKLVERFDSQREAYQSGRYNEAQIRAEFIDPLFKALGWDVHNEQSYAEAYKDVIHEDAIKIGGATEAPDLCFRIGGARKFFVECKKPSVNIKDDVHPAYQPGEQGYTRKRGGVTTAGRVCPALPPKQKCIQTMGLLVTRAFG